MHPFFSAKDFTAKVLYSDIEDTTQIKTDNDKINRLLENCRWGQYSNFIDVPTDCPQRDERLGWTGDAQVFSKTACYQADCKSFYAKYLYDLSVDQEILHGGIPMYSPSMKEINSSACSVWSDAATIIPWNLYRFYGDKTLLAKHYPLIKKYVQTLIAADNEHGEKRLYNFGFHLGDWLSQDGASANALKGATDDYFIASAYYYNSVKIAEQAAQTLGFNQDYLYFNFIADEIKTSIFNEYFSPNGRLAIDTQTAYAICIALELYVNKERIKEGYSSRIKKDGYCVKGGFVGATQLVQTLISCGLIDEAFRILYSENYPSWLYCVNLGATTIWERWNSLNKDGSISSTGMNSLNHYSYGAVAEAFYGYIAGLQPASVAFKRAIISPVFNYRLKNLEFTYSSQSGEYKIKYSVESGNKVLLHIEVPTGCMARLEIIQSKTFIPKELVGGVYDIEVDVDTELNHPFSLKTPLCDILSNEQTAKLLKDVSPNFFYYFTTTDTGLSGEPLGYVANIDAFKIPEIKLRELEAQLKQI